MFSEEERKEILRVTNSSSLKKDIEYLSSHRHNPVIIEGRIDLDRLIEFLTQFNEFINHEMKPFKPIIEKEMKL
ncbi:MAG: hypothetical protein SNJ53_09105 [Thermodesulfovibrionales bacterium]